MVKYYCVSNLLKIVSQIVLCRVSNFQIIINSNGAMKIVIQKMDELWVIFDGFIRKSFIGKGFTVCQIK